MVLCRRQWDRRSLWWRILASVSFGKFLPLIESQSYANPIRVVVVVSVVFLVMCQQSMDRSQLEEKNELLLLQVAPTWNVTGDRSRGEKGVGDDVIHTSMAAVHPSASSRRRDGVGFSGGGGRTKRDIFHLYNMMSCTTHCDPLSYKGYGCYCGFLGSGHTVDAIDR